jgi:PTS system mannose-specific IIA component
MIGVVVVAHMGIGREMVAAVQKIIPEANNFAYLCVEQDESPASIRERVTQAIEKVNSSKGILILTDMFGGTPSNVCLSFLSRPKTEVISGFNLPMLIKLASFTREASFEEIATFIQQYGQRNIVIASHVLSGRIHHE